MSDLEKFLNECDYYLEKDECDTETGRRLLAMVRLLMPTEPHGQFGRLVLEQLNKIAKGE